MRGLEEGPESSVPVNVAAMYCVVEEILRLSDQIFPSFRILTSWYIEFNSLQVM